MRVAVLHSEITGDSSADEADVLVQAESVTEALLRLGHEPIRVTMDLDLESAAGKLTSGRPDAVFNLVESLDGSGGLIHLAPALLEHLGLRFTGSGSRAMLLSTDKILSKERLAGAGIPTPLWHAGDADGQPRFNGPYIVKPVCEDASVGIDDSSVAADHAELEKVLEAKQEQFGLCFAEQFIKGREFNLSLLDGPDGPQVLPPAEIVFRDFPESKPRIVGYEAKWDEGGFEYTHTERTFDFPDSDCELLDRLNSAARECWHLFFLKGYGRVDFRVDRFGCAYVLEVNANPCIAPDAGFTAAAGRAGLDMTDIAATLLRAS